MTPEEPKDTINGAAASPSSTSEAKPIEVSEPAPAEAIGASAVEPVVEVPAATNVPETPVETTPVTATPQLITSQPATTYTAGTPLPATAIETPETTQPPTIVTGGAGSGPQTTTADWSQPKRPKSKKKLGLLVAVVVLLLILGGGYAFAFYLPNTPANVYETGLDHTARAYDKLVNYSQSVSAKHYSSSKLSGDFKLVSGAVSADGTFSGASDNKNASVTVNANIAGEKLAINGRVITATGQDTPDVYFQVNGIKSFLDSYGLQQFDTLDGQWVSVDHTILESAAANAANDSKSTNQFSSPTSAQVQDALAKVGAVNRQYLFKADANHAVLQNKKYLGKSTQYGRQVYGYEVGYDKAHLKDYLKALQSAVNDSSLNSWIKLVSGKSASQVDISSLLSAIDKSNGNYTFTMYIDAKTKLVDLLHFKDTSSSDYFEVGQGYTGGDSYPFSFKLVSTSDSSSSGTFTMNANLNSATNAVSLTADLEMKQSGSPVSFKFDAQSTYGNDKVQVTAPANAKPIMDIYNSLGLNDLFGGSTTTDTSAFDSSLNDFTLTQ